MKKLRVLFVCIGNRARSQMAEGFLRHLAGDRFEVYSAGTKPKGLSPITVAVMREVGIDVSAHRSKSVEEFVGEDFDYVITVCDVARAACPRFDRSRRQLHWGVTDPAELEAAGVVSIEAFRAARDEVRVRVEEFIGERMPGRATK
jgi:arsenate reductase